RIKIFMRSSGLCGVVTEIAVQSRQLLVHRFCIICVQAIEEDQAERVGPEAAETIASLKMGLEAGCLSRVREKNVPRRASRLCGVTSANDPGRESSGAFGR